MAILVVEGTIHTYIIDPGIDSRVNAMEMPWKLGIQDSVICKC